MKKKTLIFSNVPNWNLIKIIYVHNDQIFYDATSIRFTFTNTPSTSNLTRVSLTKACAKRSNNPYSSKAPFVWKMIRRNSLMILQCLVFVYSNSLFNLSLSLHHFKGTTHSPQSSQSHDKISIQNCAVIFCGKNRMTIVAIRIDFSLFGCVCLP